ncbi:MAG TPA: M28 family metallopeptidase [Pyrinomonadaceae bacterium]|nr:M28 family metallopeptidase [Pyrinomonadaceae bacterium]
MRRLVSRFLLPAALLAQTLGLVSPAPAQTAAFDGFTTDEAAAQRELEQRFRAVPQPASAREHLRRLTAEPHLAGTREGQRVALYIRDQLRAAGLSAELREYQVLLAYPRRPSVVELVAPRRERLPLRESVVAQDATSAHARIVPLFNGYSASGDVTAPLVYVNYGLPDDYAALKRIGVDVRGRVVIARYGRSFRGVKAKVAEQNGARALIIYSDPADDGYMQGVTYPRGPWRPPTSAQRGSVQYIFEYPGDPLTPGVAAVEGATRLPVARATNVPRIPVQPVSYADARRLLEPLRGPLRPRGCQGGLPFPYHVGGTPDVRVRVATDMAFETRTIANVEARLEGAQEPDRWVVLGNHHDAWVFGAVDPNSGTTAMLEVGRALGELTKRGWRPRRTLVLCAWDAEEYGLVGSTEWAEEHAAELREKAVAYLNMDAAVSGANFGAASVPSLWKLLRAATRDVRDPRTRKSVYEAWQDRARETDAELTDAAAGTDTPQAEARIGSLGSGSDYTPFLQHLGVPALDMGFGGDYGVYHSAYDSFNWMAKFGDPTFEYHVASAQLWGTVALRLAEARALPFDYTDYAAQIREFVAETQRAALRRGLAPVDFDARAMLEAVAQFESEARRANERRLELVDEYARTRLRADDSNARAVARLRRLNDSLLAAERALTDARGLRGRPWYKHQIYAPGFYTGYAAQPLPDLRQAVDERNPTEARQAAERITAAVLRAAAALRRGRD